MGVSELRRRISLRVRHLSEDRLRVADDFLAYLQEREDNAATRELLAIPGFLEAFRRATKQADTGDTVPLTEVRRNV